MNDLTSSRIKEKLTIEGEHCRVGLLLQGKIKLSLFSSVYETWTKGTSISTFDNPLRHSLEMF